MLKFILSSKFQMNKTSLFNLANNFKMFARKELNKANLIENFHNLNRMDSKQQNLHHNENFDKKHGEEIFNNTSSLFSIGDSKKFIESNLLNLKQGDSLQNKFLFSIRKNLQENKLLENKKFIDCLNEISINYSQNNSSFLHSTLFKFLVLIDQIVSNKSLVDYQQANVTHFAFAHLINYFGQNFFTIFDKNSEILLNYNFLYFMTINKGEFSECLKTIMEIVPNNQKFYKLLSTQFVITEQSDMEKIHNKEYFNFIEKNVTTPSSDLIKDYSFKYNERNLKMKLLNENVKEKQEYEKIRLIFHNLIKFRNTNENINSEFLKELELYLDSFFPQLLNNSDNVLTEDYIQVKTSIDNFNKFLRNKLSLFTKINTNNKIKDSITFFNIEQIFNPLFSGENDISAQFNIVSDHFGNLYAFELLYKYLDSQFEGEVFSFNDLYKLDLILIPFKFSSLIGVYDNVRFITHKQDVLKGIQLNMKTNSKFKINRFFSDEVERKPKRVEETRTNFEKSPKQVNSRDFRNDEKSSKFGDNLANQKRETMFNKPQDKKDNLKNIKLEEKKEAIFGTKIIKENAQPVKKDTNVTANISNEGPKALEPNKEEKVATEKTFLESDNVMKKEDIIPVEASNVITTPKVEISSDSTQVDLKTSTDDKLTNVTSVLDKNTEANEAQNIHIHNENQNNLQKNKMKMTSNYDREKTPVNPFYKPTKRGYCARSSKNNQGEEAIKPIGQVYKEIKLAQQKEKESKDAVKKQDSYKQSTTLITEGKVSFNKLNEKTQKEFVASPKKPQDSNKESSSIKKSQAFVVPKKQEVIKNEEKDIPAAKKFKATMKIFEPIKSQKRSPVGQAVEKSTTEEKSVIKNTFIEDLEKLSLEFQVQNETFYGIYETTNRDNIDIKLAQKKFEFNYWTEKIYNENIDEMQPEQLEKHIYSIISKVLKKYLSNRDKALMVIYSLTNPELKNEFVLDLEYCFYQIFVNSPHESFDLNLGHVGYQTLLNNNLLDNTIKNRENLEKIIHHMEKNFYLPNSENIKTIIQICDKNFYPKYLKNLIDNYVLNKNIQLDIENFTLYIQIITNFDEFSQYYQNLINNSYTDFRIPVKAEFFEYLIYKYLTKLEFENIKTAMRNFNHRCITEYQDEEERLEQIYGGNNLLLLNIVQFAENARANDNSKIDNNSTDSVSLSDIKKESQNFIDIVTGAISQNKSFNKDWVEDHEFCFLLMRIYQTFSFEYKEYFTILDNLIARNEVENVFDIKALYKDILEIFRLNSGKFKNEEYKLAMKVFEKFLEKYLKNGMLNLSYEDKFDVIREENLFRYLRFFKNSKDEQDDNTHNMQVFVKLLDSVLDPLTYMKLHKVDKVNLEKVLLKVFNNRNRVQEYIYNLDISR